MSIKKTLPVRMFQKPDGRMSTIDIGNIYPEDVDYFIENDIVVSIEEDITPDNFILYACPAEDLDEESEIIVFSSGRSCEESMKELRQKSEQEFGVKNKNTP